MNMSTSCYIPPLSFKTRYFLELFANNKGELVGEREQRGYVSGHSTPPLFFQSVRRHVRHSQPLKFSFG